jgi:hypothetical protein
MPFADQHAVARSKVDMTYDPKMILETLDTVASHDEPYFDAPESTSKSKLPISIIYHST